MSSVCAFASDMGVVRNMLAAVDCNTRHFATLGYQSLTGSALFQTALTACLSIYVALLGYRLLLAPEGMRLSDGPVTALKIGAIIALVTNWSLFQTLVFDVADRAPFEIANLVSAPAQDSSSLAADPVQGVQTAYDQLSMAATSIGKAGTGVQADAGQKSQAAALLSVAAGVLFLGCAGLLAVSLIAVGVLTVVGPVFVILMLFLETRGFLFGWIRALAGSAFAILSTWTLIVLMLHVFEPWLNALSQEGDAGSLDVQTAMTAAAIVFVFAACQVALMLAGFVVACGFSPAPRRSRERLAATVSNERGEPFPRGRISRPVWLAEQLQRPGMAAYYTRTATAAAGSSITQSNTSVSTVGRHFYRRPFLSHQDPAEAK